MPRGFQIPSRAYGPYPEEPLTPEEQEAYARLKQGFRYVEPLGPVAPEQGFSLPPGVIAPGRPGSGPTVGGLLNSAWDAVSGATMDVLNPERTLNRFGNDVRSIADGGITSRRQPYTPEQGIGTQFGEALESVPVVGPVARRAFQIGAVPGSAAMGAGNLALTATGGIAGREIAEGLGFGETGQMVADIAGSIAAPMAAPAVARGSRALNALDDTASLQRAAGVTDSSTRGIMRESGGVPGSVERATDVPFRPRISGASDDTAEAVQNIADTIVPGEKPSIGLLRQYEGRVNTQGLNIRRELDQGNRLLKELDMGKPTGTSRVVERSPEVEDLFKALHGEGDVPPQFAGVFDRLKASVDAETQAAIDFDPKFMAHPDYFPRGWKQVDLDTGNIARTQNPGSGVMGATPGYAKPRVDATFSEILDNVYTRPDGTQYRLEPVSWNPFEQLALRKVAGAEYREQTALIDKLKLSGTAIPVDGPVPEGYRVPRVGPAFEGKPKVAPMEEGGQQFFGFTSRYAVPDNVADVLENMYGRKPDMGRVVEPVLNAGQAAKRAKLLGSLFQQVDFSTRTGVYTFGGAIDDLLSGKPISAVAKVARLPKDLGELVAANLSPKRRELLRDEILSGRPLFPERPGISLKGIAESGWNQQDITIVRRDLRSAIREAVDGESLPEYAKRNLQRLEAANSRGLFDGVYPQAQITSLKNWVLPRLMRQHPDWTDAQIMGSAANEINKAFSTLGDYQTVIKNPYLQHITRTLIFSTNEPEALLRGAGSAFAGPNKRLWAEAYAGGFLFLATLANLVHMASTAILDGAPAPLPLDRYNPVKEDDETPLGFSYNSRFLSPDTPITNGGRRLALDLMGQMDTALRVLDPVGFIAGRTNVVPRAIINQVQGEDFFENRIDQVGPKGIVSRAAQLASDLYEPISAGQVRNAAGLTLTDGEPVGAVGGAVQAAGLNLRAEPLRETVDANRYYQLAPEQQARALSAQAWGDLSAAQTVPQKYRDEIAQFDSHFEWKQTAIEQYRQMRIEQGVDPKLATAIAERDFEKNPLQKLYGDVRNVYERQFVLANPQLAIDIIGEDAKKPRDERRLSLTLEELAFLVRQSRQN